MNIKKVSEQLEITPDTICYYERIGLVPPINRNKNGVRDFTDLDIQRLAILSSNFSASSSKILLRAGMVRSSFNE